jgi:cytochrome c oxidase subunit 1
MADQEAHREAHMHMPSPSYWPMVIAFGLPVVAIGLIFSHVISVVGALLIVMGAYGWVQEPSVAESDDYDPPPTHEGAGDR